MAGQREPVMLASPSQFPSFIFLYFWSATTQSSTCHQSYSQPKREFFFSFFLFDYFLPHLLSTALIFFPISNCPVLHAIEKPIHLSLSSNSFLLVISSIIILSDQKIRDSFKSIIFERLVWPCGLWDGLEKKKNRTGDGPVRQILRRWLGVARPRERRPLDNDERGRDGCPPYALRWAGGETPSSASPTSSASGIRIKILVFNPPSHSFSSCYRGKNLVGANLQLEETRH